MGRWHIVGGLMVWWLCSGIWAARASLAAETALVIDGDVGPSFQGALFTVNLSNGQRTLLSDFSNVGQGPQGATPFGVALTADGTILVIDANAGIEGQGGLFTVDPDTGQRTLLSDFGVAGQGPLGKYPVGVALTADGTILVTAYDAGTLLHGGLFTVDPHTGQRTLLSDFGVAGQGPLGVDPYGLALTADGTILVSDWDAGTNTQGALFTVNPHTGQRTLLSDFGAAGQGPLGEDPVGVALTIDGTILVSDPNAGVGAWGRLFIVDPHTGTRLLLSEFSDAGQGPQGRNPFSLALTADGTILVSDADAGTGFHGGLFTVDPDTGQRTLLSDFGVVGQGPLGMAPFGVTTVQVETAGCGNGRVDTGEDCDLGGGVNGTAGVCCTASCTLVSTGTQCRAAAGTCDVAESCTGTSATCPANNFQPATTVCRAAVGQCDAAESCSGASTACPADNFQPATTVCRTAAGLCDAAESCTGTSTSCPADSFQPVTTVCRAAAGLCDAAESCTGTSAACSADGFRPNGTICDDGNSATSGDVCNTGVCAGVSTLLTVLSPNSGETWAIGSTQTIQWNPTGVSGKVKIELSRNGGPTWALLVNNTPNDGTQTWTVTGPATSQALVRVSSMTTPSIADTSNAVFTISGGSVTVITPNGGETWAIGSTKTIQWSSSGLSGKVKIELSRNGGTTWTLLSNNVTNTGSKTWKVTKPATTQARIRVSGVSDTGAIDTSNANFTIQ